MTRLRALFLIHATVATLFGIYFAFGAASAITTFQLGDVTTTAVLFCRAVGAQMLGVALINWLCPGDLASAGVRAVVIGNIVLHAFAVAADLSVGYSRSLGVWMGLAIHVIFVVAFGYFLLAADGPRAPGSESPRVHASN